MKKSTALFFVLFWLAVGAFGKGDCTGASDQCKDIFKSSLATTGGGILSLESGVKVTDINQSGEKATSLFGAHSQCKTVNLFGDGSVCQYQPNSPSCNGGDCKTSGNATKCLTQRQLGSLDYYTDKLGVGNPWTFIVGEVRHITEPNTINAMYLNSGSTVVIDQVACAASGNPLCKDVFTLYLNALHIHTGANLIIKGKVKILIKFFGFGTWIKAPSSKIIIPKDSELEIRANDWIRFSSDIFSLAAPGNPYSSIIVDGKLKVYALGRNEGKPDIEFTRQDGNALVFNRKNTVDQHYITTCNANSANIKEGEQPQNKPQNTPENEQDKDAECTLSDNNKTVTCLMDKDLSDLMAKGYYSTPVARDGGYDVNPNANKLKTMLTGCGEIKDTHDCTKSSANDEFKKLIKENACMTDESNLTVCEKDSLFSTLVTQAQCRFNEKGEVECQNKQSSYCNIGVEKQEGDIRFEPGLKLFVNPYTRASAQFFAKGDIIGGERWRDTTAGAHGPVHLNWSYVTNTDDYVECRLEKEKSCGINLKIKDHNDSAGLGMYAGGQIRFQDGSKIRGLLYSASSEQYGSKAKDGSQKRYYGTPYCSYKEEWKCYEALLESKEYKDAKSKCVNGVHNCWLNCKECWKDLEESRVTNNTYSCRFDCGRKYKGRGQEESKNRCSTKCINDYKDAITKKCTQKYDGGTCAKGCRKKFGLDAWRTNDTTNCWVNVLNPMAKNLCLGDVGQSGLSKILAFKTVYNFQWFTNDWKTCKVKYLCNEQAGSNKCKNMNERELGKDRDYGIYLGSNTQLVGSAVSKYVVAEQGSSVTYDARGVQRSRADELCKASQRDPRMRKTNFSYIGGLNGGAQIGNVDGWDPDPEDRPTIKYKIIDGDSSERFTIDKDGNLKLKGSLPQNFSGTLTFKAKIYSGAEVKDENGNVIGYSGGERVQTISVTICPEVSLINISNSQFQKEYTATVKDKDGVEAAKKIKSFAMVTRAAGDNFKVKVQTGCRFGASKNLEFNLKLFNGKNAVNEFKPVKVVLKENADANLAYSHTIDVKLDTAHKDLRFKATDLVITPNDPSLDPEDLEKNKNRHNNTYASDNFSVRPKDLVIPVDPSAPSTPAPRKLKNESATPPILRDVLVAGKEYVVKVKSSANGFKQPVELNASGPNGGAFFDLAQSNTVTIGAKSVVGVTLDGTTEKQLKFSYKNVGNVNLVLRDENWTNVDRPELNKINGAEPDEQKWECSKEPNKNSCANIGDLCSCETRGVWQVSFVPERYETRLEY
ncbi:MAG: cadherin repeat domain-containing protein, partial [Helicobacteraceae bacterium]